MITAPELAALLRATEQAHAASGHDAHGWAEWYAQYMLPRLIDQMEQSCEIARKRGQTEVARAIAEANGGWYER